MDIFELLIIAISLTFDTFAVSVSTGIIDRKIMFGQAFRIAVVLGIFQAVMPVIGWATGNLFTIYFNDYDHWIAFGLLTVIGVKMIIESLKHEEDRKEFNPFKIKILLLIAIATSIDALVVGVTFAFIKINIIHAFLIIGFTTFLVAMLGMLFGKNAGRKLGKKAEIIGGLMLIAIGVKILIEHLVS